MRFLSYLPALLVLLFSAAAHAQGAGGLVSEEDVNKVSGLFMPPESDETLGWIVSVFGPTLFSDAGEGSQPLLIGVAMGVLNSAALAIGALILTYKLLAGVAQTAHEGNLLGKRWSTLWGPLRVGLGAAALIPLNSGFCLMQKMVVLVAAMGIGLADNIWKTSMDSVGTMGTVIAMPRVRGFEPTGHALFQTALCAAAVEEWTKSFHQSFNSLPEITINIPPSIKTVSEAGMQDNAAPDTWTWANAKQMFGLFGYGEDNYITTLYGQEMGLLAKYKGICGGFRGLTIGSTSNTAGQGVVSPMEGDVRKALNQGLSGKPLAMVHSEAAHNYLNTLLPVARQIALANLPNSKACGVEGVPDSPACAAPDTNVAAKGLMVYSGYVQTAAVGAINAANSKVKGQGAGQAFASVAGSMGWAYAGSWWMVLNRLNGTANEIANQRLEMIAPQWGTLQTVLSDKYSGIADFGSYLTNVKAAGDEYWSKANLAYAADAAGKTESPTYDQDARRAADTASAATQSQLDEAMKFGNRDDIHVDGFWDKVGNVFVGVSQFLGEGIMYLFDPVNIKDPEDRSNIMASLTSYGQTLAATAGWMIVAGYAAETIEGASDTGIVSWIGQKLKWLSFVGIALKFLTPLLKLLKALGMLLLVPGLTMGYVLPMIPYILWVGGLVGWFILVVEAVVAAPLWALAHMRMDGEGIAGPVAQTGYRLLLNLLLRPALMIIGLLMGMVVFSTVGPFIGISFAMATRTTFGAGGAGLLGSVVMIFLMTAMFFWISYKCFGMIHQVPDRIMRWIGGGPEGLGEDEVVNQSRTMAAVAMGQMVTGMRGVPGLKQRPGQDQAKIGGANSADKTNPAKQIANNAGAGAQTKAATANVMKGA